MTGRLEGLSLGRPVVIDFLGDTIVVGFNGLLSLVRTGMANGGPLEPLLRLLLRNRMVLKASIAGRFEQALLPVPSLGVRLLSRNLRKLSREMHVSTS